VAKGLITHRKAGAEAFARFKLPQRRFCCLLLAHIVAERLLEALKQVVDVLWAQGWQLGRLLRRRRRRHWHDACAGRAAASADLANKS
jgi:hypothetical protein